MLIFYLIINVVTFAAFGVDKYKAIQRQWRIPEKTLLGLIVFGGGLGALLGMKVFRHKTRHPEFWVVSVLCVLVHVGVVGFLLMR